MKTKQSIEQLKLERKKILEFTTDKFFREGFYKTPIDSIASELRISKKTIYKHFATKEELIEQLVFDFISVVSEKMDSVVNSDKDSLSKALLMFEIIGNVTLKFSDKWIKDIQIHMPELWKKIDDFRTKRAYTVLSNIIRQGQEEGMINDKPAELIIHLFVSSMRSIVNPDFLFYQKFSYKEAFQHSFEILFNGILTQKGKKQFDKIFSRVIL